MRPCATCPGSSPSLDSDAGPGGAGRSPGWPPTPRDPRAFRAALAADWPPCPPGVAAKAARLGADATPSCPAWLRAECPEAFAPAERDALLTRAPPVAPRCQRADPAAVRARVRRGAVGPGGRARSCRPPVDLEPGADVTATDRPTSAGGLRSRTSARSSSWTRSGPAPGGRWLDACAGRRRQDPAAGRPPRARRAGSTRTTSARPPWRSSAARAARAGLAGRIARAGAAGARPTTASWSTPPARDPAPGGARPT